MARTLAISLAGLRKDDPTAAWYAGPRAAVAWAAGLGVRGVQLDAAAPGVRARDLDRSARRDLAALLRRSGLEFTGLDLWLPGEHLKDTAHVDRAVAAITGAIALAGELAPLAGESGRLVSLMLPVATPADVIAQIGSEADHHGVMIADHAWPPAHEREAAHRPRAATDAPVASTPAGSALQPSAVGAEEVRGRAVAPTGASWPVTVGVGLDPAAVALAGDDIGGATARAADRLVSARLCDLSSAGRVLPGSADGRLDLLAYHVALSLAPERAAVVVDVRGLQEQDTAARRMIGDWNGGELADPRA